MRSDAGAISKMREVWPLIADPPSRSEIVETLRNHFRRTNPQSTTELIDVADDTTFHWLGDVEHDVDGQKEVEQHSRDRD
jgi:hypothetical protein